ncbi:hypothetical protein hmeg3_13070 [Herbaspirillum sp. meg3]|uniref:radical SAM/SPASM domain-containing protein n=1 Tax=Herbaspirillum sp. meg3 TaxID=2025949 RepID=UPI000B985C86|nr:radical SAM protein [Herbaspirillum sp. meg3]ASU39125.1 hypothetical protein hmeg3_13070 [Herbaspirillum sp. meg3]
MTIQPVRLIRLTDKTERRPVYAVWELTLRCNLKCNHCGSRAGEQRSGELTTEEAFHLIDELAELGVRELAVIGGEAYLRRDWLEIIERICSYGIRPVLQTGGYGLSEKVIVRAKSSGLAAIGVSVDGTSEIHDKIRGVNGAHYSALQAIRWAKKHGLAATANTQIHSRNWRQLPEILLELADAGIEAWQLQLTVAMGNAVENSQLLLQPYFLDELFPILAKLFEECDKRGIEFQAGNNIGYFGPYEHLWRGPTRMSDHYDGCQAGINGIGIEADGTIKGCPSLATSRYTEGNVKRRRLKDIWTDRKNFQLNRVEKPSLWGFCKSCYYSSVCRGGCVWTSDSLLGRPGNNPYCHHRVLALKAQNIREKIVKVHDAQQSSFGVGLFQIVEEAWDD